LTTEKIDVVAPMLSASVAMAATVKVGARRRLREERLADHHQRQREEHDANGLHDFLLS